MAKVCGRCKSEKEPSEFNRRAKSLDGLCHVCRACSAEKNRAWRAQNPNGFKKWSAENKERRKESFAAWCKANPDRQKERYRQWVDSNRASVYARTAARVAAQRRAIPAWADQERIRSIYAEAVRLSRETGVRHEVDHFYPLKGEMVSGLHVETNLQILTRSENARKRNKMPDVAAAETRAR